MRVTAPREIREPEDLAFLSTAHRARKRLEIDLTDVEWISPLGVVAVLATCLRAEASALGVAVCLPHNREVRTYLGHIGLLRELDRSNWTLTRRPSPEEVDPTQREPYYWSEIEDIEIDPDATFAPHLPVSRLTTLREVDIAADRLEDALRAAPHIRGGLFDELMTVAVELSANAREHGSDCYAVAQVHTGRRSSSPGVRLAVADFGVGLAETLQEHHGEMTDGDAIIRAFEEQVSGTGRSERGFGLTQVAEIVDGGATNVLHVISHSGHVVRSGGEFRVTESEALLFRGTLASAYLASGFI